jgi:hypothetical protein
VSNTRIYAFDTPNYPPLLEAKTTLEVDPKMLIHPPGTVPDECRVHDKLSRKVYVLKVAPTITPEIIRAACSGMEGKILLIAVFVVTAPENFTIYIHIIIPGSHWSRQRSLIPFTQTFRFFYIYLIPHTSSPVLGTLSLAFL